MFYYNVCILKTDQEFLTYESECSVELNSIVDVKVRNKLVKALVLKDVEKPSFKTLSILDVTSNYISNKQLELAKFMSEYYVSSLGQTLALFTPFDKTVKLLDTSLEHKTDILLSDAQQKAYNFLDAKDISLLFASTGAGKSEIYMKLFEKELSKGKQVLLLMPEISLTPQMKKRLEKNFDTEVIMWHSKITKNTKKKYIEKILSGEVKIIAGARSALFLPLDNLGAIVVDEEHDDSYKSNQNPRYNAKDMAIFFSSKFKIKCVLGSATPSLNTYKKIPHHRLKETFIKTNKEYVFETSYDNLSDQSLYELKECVKRGEQAIVFIPVRANFKNLECSDCGYNYDCPYCSVSMSVHNKKNALKCHYCNFTQAIPKTCHNCKGDTLSSSRLGTAQAVVELEKLGFRAKAFDRDEITTQKKLKDTLKAFNDKEIDVLVGTQMLSKGHDYPNVTLAIILGIDAALHQADFRASYKALSSMLQISGRSGRAKDAKVIVQSHNESFFRKYLDDFQVFLDDELKVNKMYPPHTKLAKVLFAHKNKAKAQDSMHSFLDNLKNYKDVEVIGFGESPINLIASKHRYQIMLRSTKIKGLLTALHNCKNELSQIDVDPLEFS